MLQQYIEKVKNKLKESLPGEQAHRKMVPYREDRSNISDEVPTKTKQGSVLILLYPQRNKVCFPLMLRPDYNGVHGGQISLPGGKKEKQDADFIATATREAEEEIGVKAGDIQVLGTLSQLYISASNFTVLPVVGFVRSTPAFIPNPYEVEAIIEATVDDLIDDKIVKTKDLVVRGVPLTTPYFNINGQVVWGATAMILNEFKSILKSSEPLRQ